MTEVSAQGGLEGTYKIIIEKQEEKKRSRWSIYDWLETKKKFRLQDQWLALNSSDVAFESLLGGRFVLTDSGLGDALSEFDFDRYEIEGALFYRLIGIRGSYTSIEGGESGWDGSLHLRLLGTSMQNSNFTLGYGVRGRDELDSNGMEDSVSNSFAEASMTIYLLPFLGLEGVYQWLFSAESDNGFSWSGGRTEVMTFFEFSFFRVFLGWYSDDFEVEQSGLTSDVEREGWNTGLQIYF